MRSPAVEIDWLRLERLLETIASGVGRAASPGGLDSPAEPPAARTPAIGVTPSTYALDAAGHRELVRVLRELEETLAGLRVKSGPLGGGEIDLANIALRDMDREALIRFRAELLQGDGQARSKFILTPLAKLLEIMGKPTRVCGNEDGSEAWQYWYDNYDKGVDFTARDGFVIGVVAN